MWRSKMLENADTDKDKLIKRINTHDKYSKYDINNWIFKILKIKGKESVLDIGCGTGKQLIPIAEKTSGLVVGVDVSEESLNHIKSVAANKKLDIKLLKSSMENMGEKLKDFHKFDIIISCFAIYYSDNPAKTIKLLKQHLKDNGRMFICGPSENNNRALLELHNKIGKISGMHKGFFENFAISFLKEKFNDVQIFRFKNPIIFPDLDSLIEYWLSYSIGDKDKEQSFRKIAEPEFKEGNKFTTVKEVIGILAFK